jgi:hypothetical protein
MRILPVLLALLILSMPVAAQVYKWTDANGKVHYSDKAVGNGEPIRIPKSPQADPEANTRLQQFRNQLEGSQQNKQNEAEAAQKLAGEQQAACEKTRLRLQRYEEVGQIVQMKDGQREYLDYKQKDAQMTEMRQFLKENCD